ncbi:MAG: hypothetical protein ABF290_06150 [Thiogranum sp.]
MRKRIRSSALALVLGMTSALMCSGASATGFDGTANLVCAAIDVVGCVDGSGCVEGQARTFELPGFMFVDFEKKLIRATKESGQKEVSPIKNYEQTEKQVILQGVENHRAWSAAIDRQTGRMTVTSAGSDVSFMIFGACTAL